MRACALYQTVAVLILTHGRLYFRLLLTHSLTFPPLRHLCRAEHHVDDEQPVQRQSAAPRRDDPAGANEYEK